MSKYRSILACVLAAPAITVAQVGLKPEPEASRWGLGLGLSVSDSPYAGEGTKTTPLPLILFESERFFFRGLFGGVRLLRDDTFTLSAIAALRLDGIDADDFGVRELARNGVDRDLLEDRDDGLDVGLAASWRTSAGDFELTARADVTGASEGYEVTAEYGYGFDLGRGNLTPVVGVSYLSKDMANYYYGTLKEEVTRGVVAYKLGAVTVPKLGLSYTRPIGERWQLMTRLQYKFLPDKISDSPLIESDADGETSFILGISRSF